MTTPPQLKFPFQGLAYNGYFIDCLSLAEELDQAQKIIDSNFLSDPNFKDNPIFFFDKWVKENPISGEQGNGNSWWRPGGEKAIEYMQRYVDGDSHALVQLHQRYLTLKEAGVRLMNIKRTIEWKKEEEQLTSVQEAIANLETSKERSNTDDEVLKNLRFVLSAHLKRKI